MKLELDIQIESPNLNIPQESDLIKIVEQVLSFNNINTAALCIRIVTDQEIQDLNKNYRDKDKPTNVLSFPFDAPPEFNENNYLGDIIVAADVVEHEAVDNNKPIFDHWTHMVIHGVLHLLGYDHIDNDEAEEMEGLEVEILKKLNINNPYIKT